MFHRKDPLTAEWEKLIKQESKLIKEREEKKDSLLNQQLASKVPPKLQDTLNKAFAKAFGMVFEKGTDVIEKTHKKEDIEKTYKINQYTHEIRQNKKSLKAFSKNASKSGRTNMLVSGVAGIGMGIVGVGIPDIPVFTAMILKSIYEIALNYGYEYESVAERRFILLLIQGAVSYGPEMLTINHQIDDYMENVACLDTYDEKQQIEQTAAGLSKELLYMKFLQGIPVVGAVGGAYDVVYMKRIVEYAGMKYKKRFLYERLQK